MRRKVKVTINGRDLSNDQIAGLQAILEHYARRAKAAQEAINRSLVEGEEKIFFSCLVNSKDILQMLLDESPKSNLESTQ